MSKSSAPPLNRQILEEASDWFVDFRVGDVDAAAGARFDEWVRRSPEHIRAYWEIAKTYVELPSTYPGGRLDVAALIAYARSDDNVVQLRSAATEPRHTAPPKRRAIYAIAASLAFALVISGALLWQTYRYPVYVTDIGERRSITLDDGSTVDLNARSRLRIDFSRGERRVDLIDGQALFQVAKDKQRPFIVYSGDAAVRAVGTQFDVYRRNSGTTVTVLEGRVAVYSDTETQSSPNSTAHTHATSSRTARGAVADVPTPPHDSVDSSGSAAVYLSAGEQVVVTPQAIAPRAHADVAAATAWVQRKLIFDGSKLSDVVLEFNRYNRRPMVIDDPALRDFDISGVYLSTDPTSLLRFLRDQGVKVTETENEIRLEAR